MNCSCDEPQYHMMSVDKYVCGVCNGSPPEAWHASVWAARGVKPAEDSTTVIGRDICINLDDFAAMANAKLQPTIDRAIAECERIAAEAIDHPAHYNKHPSGVECIDVVEHMMFNLGNAIKYIWRADHKNDAIEDLRKAVWYIEREIERRVAAGDSDDRE